MAYINQIKVDQINSKLCDDESQLKKIYKAKRSSFLSISVTHSLVDDYLKEGWEEERQNAYKTILRKPKSHSQQFEDDIWCQFYELGYRTLNYDENFHLPFSNNDEDTKQIDVIAIDKETVFLIECKSSEKIKSFQSFREVFDALEHKIAGFRKVSEQAFGKGKKLKYIFATRNLRIDNDSPDLVRLQRTGAFYFNDNTYNYINSLIKSYKGIAIYQFLGLIFKNELINSQRIEIPALEGDMGGKKYYMFSIEPSLLLKMGYVLHRTKANESEFPTYQRLLIPSRLSGITKYIDKGGYFPNSIILNFSATKHRIQFEPSSRSSDSSSRFGMLKIPNAYGIAYIIDGQHRVYGYANSNYKESNTIPVVAFNNLTTIEQLEIFMDINQNQKAVSPSLRYDLEEDLFWDSDRADSRLKALRSSIIKGLANSTSSSLYNRISIGEDSAMLPFKPFYTALAKSGLLPNAKGNQYDENYIGAVYNTNNHNHEREMERAKKYLVQLLIISYNYVQDNYPEIFDRQPSFIISPRGTFAYIGLIGSLNSYLVAKSQINLSIPPKERFSLLEKYIKVLLDRLSKMTKEEEEAQFVMFGSGADTKWLRHFQSIVNEKFKDFNPLELIDWKERQDEELQQEARKLSVSIEKKLKLLVLDKIQMLYGEHWELEINSIKRDCQERAEKEMEKNYKEGLKRKKIEWTEMLTIMDYKSIIEKYWTKTPELENEAKKFITFEKCLAIDCGYGFNSKSEKLKWISIFNTYRNQIAHEGTKDDGLNKEEVSFIQKIHRHFESFK